MVRPQLLAQGLVVGLFAVLGGGLQFLHNRFVTMQINPILTQTNLDQIQAFNVTGGGNAVDGGVGNNNIIRTPGG